jgi:hypothetical protein
MSTCTHNLTKHDNIEPILCAIWVIWFVLLQLLDTLHWPLVPVRWQKLQDNSVSSLANAIFHLLSTNRLLAYHNNCVEKTLESVHIVISHTYDCVWSGR